LTLPNFIAAPHVAGVIFEAVDRMGVAAVENILSVLDGKPIRDNIVYTEVLD
jgi:D-3-phosphoglycerate dehydrogenase / 2-oxoglutarate reductase